jgi:hypothetical protein
MDAYTVLVAGKVVGTANDLGAALEKKRECEKEPGVTAEITTGVWGSESTVEVVSDWLGNLLIHRGEIRR